jgi:hypothetical protein
MGEPDMYVATMIDDYSEYTTPYLLERKSDLKGVLRNYLKFMKERVSVLLSRIFASSMMTQATALLRLLRDEGLQNIKPVIFLLAD